MLGNVPLTTYLVLGVALGYGSYLMFGRRMLVSDRHWRWWLGVVGVLTLANLAYSVWYSRTH